MPSRHFEEFIKTGIMDVTILPNNTQHNEPECTSEGNRCRYMEPHNHGLACDDDCMECQGKCHPTCPQYGRDI